MSLFGGINYNKTFISTTTMLFIFTITLGLLFFVSALSHQIFAQEGNIYEGLGIKLKYFNPWTIEGNDDDPSCLDLCLTALFIPSYKAGIMIMQEKFDKPDIKNKCKCDTLLEFVKYRYEIISESEENVFINDNQTTLTDGNIPAIQMEFENKGDTLKKSVHILTKGPNSFYGIVFSADKNEQYSNYLDDFKKMLNSLEFVSTNETKKKQPSFLADNNTKEMSTTTDIVDKESSRVDLSDIKDKRTDIEIDDSNFDLFYSSPESHISKKISITGKIFNTMAPSGDSGGLQIYHLGNQDKDTIISYSLSQIGNSFSNDECVKIEGSAGPTYQYTNAFGAYRTSPMIFASSIQKIDCLDMVDPKAKIIPIGQSLEKGGIKVTLNKVEFDDKNTRAFLTIENTNDDEDEILRFYDTSDSKAFQGKRQYEAQYSSSYPDISSSIPPGIEESGVVLFEPLEYGLDTKFEFDMSIGLDDYKFVFNTNTIGQLNNQIDINQFEEDEDNAPEVLTFTEDRVSEVLGVRQGDEDKDEDDNEEL